MEHIKRGKNVGRVRRCSGETVVSGTVANRPQTSGLIIQPLQTVAEDVFIWATLATHYGDGDH